jgi:hypothetical protein
MSDNTPMTSRERMDAAMRPRNGRLPDRVPVMCQLALGHYFLHAGDSVEIWHDSHAFAEALVTLQRRYRFDGILVNLPGRDPAWRRQVQSVEEGDTGRLITWRHGRRTIVPRDDNPHVHEADGRAVTARLEDVDPERLFYIEPHDLAGVTYPTTWGCAEEPAIPGPGFFPPWHRDTLRQVRAAAPEVSVHGEVFSPFSQLMELVGYTSVLGALILDPGKVTACLERLTDGAVLLARGHFEAGADAVLISSAFAGAGFLSPDHYRRFVLPFERRIVEQLAEAAPGKPIYTHTCGAIGDRLELMEQTETHGIDTLDPPPLGTVDLADAKRRLGCRLFIKGNVDPVNTVLLSTPEPCYEDACARVEIAKPGGGYILSTACSVPPHAPPENILALARAAEARGHYR